MAKITVVGDAVVITSALKLEDIKTVAKYRPEELIVYQGEGDEREAVFAVGVAASGAGSINRLGAVFARETRDEDKFAMITDFLAEKCGDVREFLADKYGAALMNLNKIEERLPSVIAEINAEKAAIMENITIAQ